MIYSLVTLLIREYIVSSKTELLDVSVRLFLSSCGVCVCGGGGGEGGYEVNTKEALIANSPTSRPPTFYIQLAHYLYNTHARPVPLASATCCSRHVARACFVSTFTLKPTHDYCHVIGVLLPLTTTYSLTM